MIGRMGETAWGEVPINPAQVHTIDLLDPLAVRRLGLRDTLRITVLPDSDEENGSEVLGAIRGVKAYLFREDYLEGMVYSRIMIRRRWGVGIADCGHTV